MFETVQCCWYNPPMMHLQGGELCDGGIAARANNTHRRGPFIALDMEATLSAAGAEAISKRHLGEAFEAAKNANISAAVLDVNLGEGDCAPLCEVLARRQIPFIFHTGYMDGGPLAKWLRPVCLSRGSPA